MILLDLSHGITFPLLFKIASMTHSKVLTSLAKSLEDCAWPGNPPTDPLLVALKKKTASDCLQALKGLCATIPPIATDNITVPIPSVQESIVQTLRLFELNNLDPMEYYIYISLVILLTQGEYDWKILAPAVNTNSSKTVFRLFGNRTVILAGFVPSISPLLAAFLTFHFEQFLTRLPDCRVAAVDDVTDPFDKTVGARLFTLTEHDDAHEMIAVIEANIDDMTPEILAQAMQTVLKKKALDYTIMPAVMKKGRQGFQVQVLARLEDRCVLEKALLEHTTTFGVRTSFVCRKILKRTVETFASQYGSVRVKKGVLEGHCLRRMPEFRDIAAISAKTGLPALKIYNDVLGEIGAWQQTNSPERD